MITLNLQANVDNASLQIGDIIYYESNDSVFELGPVLIINSSSIIVDATYHPGPNTFIMFVKNPEANSSSLKGYYSEIKMQNNTMEKAELFAVSSEVAISSK